jgi:signal transduction histidine kinase
LVSVQAPIAPPSTSRRGTLSTNMLVSLAALGAALIALFGDTGDSTWVTVVFALVGLVPWALEAGGIRLPPTVLLMATLVPAALVALVDQNPGGCFPAMLAVVAVTSRHCGVPLTLLSVGGAVGIVAGLAMIDPEFRTAGAVYFVGGIGVSWMAGTLLYQQESLVAELRLAADREAKHAAAEERARIAREVHDVVAHSLTVTMLHVTGARRALTSDPGRAADALERAENVGRESLDSIRRVVGLLRTPDSVGTGEGSDPLPHLGDLPGLVDRYREAGLQVAAEVEVAEMTADAATSLAAFRVVQEALSNVLQHSPGASARLRVVPDAHGSVLRIVVENALVAATPPAPAPEGAASSRRRGLGVLGMHERARAAGGSAEAGPTEHGTWRVEAVLPLHRFGGSV